MRSARFFLALAVPVSLLGAWELATTVGGVKSYQLASPLDVGREIAELASRGLLWRHVFASAERVGLGFAIALLLAVGLGATVGLSRNIERLIDPTLQAVRAVPSLAWVPLLLLWLGIGESAKITLVAIGAFFPIYVNLVAGIHGVDRLPRGRGVRGFYDVQQRSGLIVGAAVRLCLGGVLTRQGLLHPGIADTHEVRDSHR